MLTINTTILEQVADQARSDAAAHPRWIAAITRALLELENNPWIDRNPEGHGLIIGSPSGQCYTANGVCGCAAYTRGKQACWHRACARLVRLHDEALERASNPAPVRDLSTTVDTAPVQLHQPQIVCQQPDNLCSVHEPCAAHAEQAAAYLRQERSLGQRRAAARTATALLNDLFA